MGEIWADFSLTTMSLYSCALQCSVEFHEVCCLSDQATPDFEDWEKTHLVRRKCYYLVDKNISDEKDWVHLILSEFFECHLCSNPMNQDLSLQQFLMLSKFPCSVHEDLPCFWQYCPQTCVLAYQFLSSNYWKTARLSKHYSLKTWNILLAH